MKPLSIRKDNRLQHYDYSRNGTYFVTVCVQDRQELLCTIVVAANCVRPVLVALSDIGQAADQEINRIADIYDGVVVDKYVVMPNHIHMILRFENGGRTQFAPTLSRVIKQFKGAITKKIGRAIWQKSFYDRIIRSEAEYLDTWLYIENNPAHWASDAYHP